MYNSSEIDFRFPLKHKKDCHKITNLLASRQEHKTSQNYLNQHVRFLWIFVSLCSCLLASRFVAEIRLFGHPLIIGFCTIHSFGGLVAIFLLSALADVSRKL